ncbi:MAG TPA: biotin/lipoyl-binding protein, partial [Longimicrobium sp.]|nr:biotin/lipoyl-binding protein [Longimicrobium sp.]
MSTLTNRAGKRAGLIAIAVLALFAAGFWLYRRADAKEASEYRFAAVERGDLQSTVSATGALSAVTTVQVGTQVSGQVSAIYADFNSRVKKGQLLARIDPTLAEQSVREAQAGLERAVAERDQARRTYDRNKTLFDRKVLTESEMNDAQYSLAVANSSVKSAQVSLERARRNLA